MRVRLEGHPGEAKTGGDTVHHDAFRQVHGVGDGHHHKLAPWPGGPIKEVVHHILKANIIYQPLLTQNSVNA